MTLALLALLACRPEPEDTGPVVTILGQEDIAVVQLAPIAVGPRLSGSLEPAQEARLQAEVGGSVRTMRVEVGERVERGEVLARIQDVAADQELQAASAAAQSAEADVALAEVQAQRTEALVEIGALARADLDLARNQLTQARTRQREARSRLTTARDAVRASVVQAPFSGVIGERAVHEGDIVQVGAPLFTVLDLSTLRVEANVPVSALGDLGPGTPLSFEVQGIPERTFVGTVERVAPTVTPGTRQIPVIASLPNVGHELVAGLYVEGRVATSLHEGLVAPLDAVDLLMAPPTVLAVVNGTVVRRVVSVGLVDEETERVELTGGIQAGDVLLVGPARDLAPGTRVELPTPLILPTSRAGDGT